MVNYSRLTKLLDEEGLSKSRASLLVGMSRCYLRDCEMFGRDIPEDRLKIIARITNTTTDYLRGMTDERYHPKYTRPASMTAELWAEIKKSKTPIELAAILQCLSKEQYQEFLTVVTDSLETLAERLDNAEEDTEEG
jgi:hypothetical protein